MISDIFVLSLDALRTHKIRTLLTVTGIIIGISSVIIVTTAGNSVTIFIEDQWDVFDPTSMLVGIGKSGDPPQLSMGEIVFTDQDIENIKGLPDVKSVAPIGLLIIKKISDREGFLKWKSTSGGYMYTSTPELLDVLRLKIESGRIFEEGKKEVVISKGYIDLFGKDKPIKIGDYIYIQRFDGLNIKSKVVGIMGQDEGYNILTQMTTPNILGPIDPYYSTYLGSNIGGPIRRVTGYGMLYASATDNNSIETAKNEILDYLNTEQSDANKYKKETSDFVIITQQYLLNKINQIFNAVSMLITIIAMISLVVGGVGIANIMYATVTERTRDIGTMMAIGAKRRQIMLLFLYQSTIIGLMGGILGCLIGASGSVIVVRFLSDYIKTIGGNAYAGGAINLIFSWDWFGIALIFGIIIGIFAGVLPARKAAKMDPVIALHYQ
jgi:putative ABC transport system permease protein